MRKTVLTFGLISGGVLVVLMAVNISLWQSGTMNFDNGEIIGYSSMIIALSMVFFGIKSFRDKHLQGVIKFGKAFTVGILITALASGIYVAGWEIYYQADDELRSTFMDKYAEHYLGKMKEKGASSEEIEAAREETNRMKEMYSVPILRLTMTLIEILPVGIIVTLISAAVLRRKEVLPPA